MALTLGVGGSRMENAPHACFVRRLSLALFEVAVVILF